MISKLRVSSLIVSVLLCSGFVAMANDPFLSFQSNTEPKPVKLPGGPPVGDPHCADASCCPEGLIPIVGGQLQDVLAGGPDGECLVGLGDNDVLYGGSGGDFLTGGEGDDTLWGDNYSDALRGNSGDDLLLGGNGEDEILGNSGDDEIHGGTGRDTLIPGPGSDAVYGDEGKDTIVVYDVCELASGSEFHGGDGKDTLVSPLGDEQLAVLGVQLTGIEITVVETSASESSECGACNCELIDDEVVCCAGHGTCNLLGDPPDDAPACDCDPGWTGPDCSIECIGGDDCTAEIFYHVNGTANGVLMRGAALYEASNEEETTAGLRQWIVENAASVGIDPLDDPTVLELTADSSFRSFGGLRTLRHRQTYRGWELIGPETQVTVTVAPPHGAISYMGTVLDPRVDYTGLDDPLSIPEATQFLEAHWESIREGAGYPGVEAEVQAVELVAVPQLEAMAYRGRVRNGGEWLATLAILAEDSDSPELIAVQLTAAEGPDDAVPIEVLAGPFEDDPSDFETDVHYWDMLPNGGPLLGSTFTPGACGDNDPPAECGHAKLGGRRLEVYDGQLQTYKLNPIVYTSPGGVFDEPRAAQAFSAQDLYVHGRALLKEVDVLKTGRWDHPPESAFEEDRRPEVALFVNSGNAPKQSCPAGAAACFFLLDFEEDGAAKWEALDHRTYRATANDSAEPMPIIINNDIPRTMFHEFGHYLDFYTASNLLWWDIIPTTCDVQTQTCGNPQCTLDSVDETYPLAESVSNMFGQAQFKRIYSDLEFDDNCSNVYLTGWNTPGGNGQLVPSDNCIEFQGQIRQWDLTRPNEPDPEGKLGCRTKSGYRQPALGQAWWSVVNGKHCQGTAPWTCQDFTVPLVDQPADAAVECLHYALSVGNAQWYDMLFKNIGVCYACVYGEDAYDSYLAVFANHGLLEGTEQVTVCPDICGDGAITGSEECDGDDFGGLDCTDFNFVGGELTCSPEDCTIDTSGCNFCGNGTIDGNEVCDGMDFGGLTCANFGFEEGDLECDEQCSEVLTDNCSGGYSFDPPGGYGGCLTEQQLVHCEELGPVGCAATYGTGECIGGPCQITNPDDIVYALDDWNNEAGEFHPDGNYRDPDGNLYYCHEQGNLEVVCIDDGGWGVCHRCDADEGDFNTRLGCSCHEEEACISYNVSDPEMSCFGEDFGAEIGYCWDEVPPWRCAEGQCGQAPWYEEDTMYCEYYAEVARCEPFLNCNGPDSFICAEQDLICDCDGGDCPADPFGDGTCTVECDDEEHCSPDFGWPAGYDCVGHKCVP